MSRTDINRTCQPIVYQTYRYQVVPTHPVNGIPGPVDTTTTAPFSVPQVSRVVRAGTVNPNYRKLLKTASLPPNTFAYSERTWVPLTGSRKLTIHNLSYDDIRTYTGCLSSTQFAGYSSAAPSALVISNLKNQSLTKALLKVKNQDVNLAEVWGERHETLKMIATNVDRIGKTYASLKHGDFRGAAAALGVEAKSLVFSSQWRKNQSKAIANGWLELQYGWKPLISDAYGAVEALHKSLVPTNKNQLIRVSAVSRLSDSSSKVTALSNGTQTWNSGFDVQVKTCLYFRQQSTTLHTLSALGITNPLYVAWELTKFSFVVDWFVHIGNFLSSIDAAFGYTYLWGCYTTGQRIYNRYEIVRHGANVYATNEWDEESTESDEMFMVNRIGLTGNFTPLPLPTFSDPSSLQHLLNSIALLRQNLKR